MYVCKFWVGRGRKREVVGSVWLLLVWKCRLRVPLRFDSVSSFPSSEHEARPYVQCTIPLHPKMCFGPPCRAEERTLLGSVAFSKQLKGIIAPFLKPQDLVPRVFLAVL